VLVPTSAGESQEEPALLLLSSRACDDRLKTEEHQGVRNEVLFLSSFRYYLPFIIKTY